MKTTSPFTPAERIESLKAAVLGGLVAGLVNLIGLLGHRWLASPGFETKSFLTVHSFWLSLAGLTLLVSGAIATLSGALFALTYRYAIRQDHNPQLNAGVVLAFTLVRGLAQVDAGSALAQNLWPFAIASGESLILFGSSAIALNWAFQQKWITRFQQREET